LIFTDLRAQAPETKERRSEGSTLYIHCPYTAQTDYWDQKAWCHMRDNKCVALVETNPTRYSRTTYNTNRKVTIEDSETCRTVVITMTNLQAEDSGTYSCASRSHDDEYHPLKTISLNVFKELHRWELDSLSVQCPYGTLGYSTGTKAWCRGEPQTGCKPVMRTDYLSTRRGSKSLEGRTLIEDDTQGRTVTITMKKLQAQDSSVYWCELYTASHPTQIMEVNLSVFKSEYLLAECACWQISAPSPLHVLHSPPSRASMDSNVKTLILIFGVLGILFILALISSVTLCIRRRKQRKKQGTRQEEDIYEKPEDIAQLESTERTESPMDDSKDLRYATLNFKSRISSEDSLYCNLEPSEAHSKAKDENVEYAVVALK
ncbi:CLM5 protein, partial [Psophia crepitans]|nr:CLM5 protein [Psophia crepitans]